MPKDVVKTMSERLQGHPVSEDTREKISNALKGRVFNEDWAKKIRESSYKIYGILCRDKSYL